MSINHCAKIEKIFVWVNNKEVRDFDGFTLQTGFHFGFVHTQQSQQSFVWNGTFWTDCEEVYSAKKRETFTKRIPYIMVYFAKMDDTWEQIKVSAKYNKPLFDGITARAATNKVKKHYVDSLGLEQKAIRELITEGYEPVILFNHNPITSHRNAKNHHKQILQSAREFHYNLQHHDSVKVAIPGKAPVLDTIAKPKANRMKYVLCTDGIRRKREV